MTDRKQIIDKLQQQIQQQRDRMDPELLARAGEVAAETMKRQMEKAQQAQNTGSTVPYDRQAALKAIELFLKHHPDPESLEALLEEIAKKVKK